MKRFYWINEQSKTFLERGYLRDKTVEDRICEIAQCAEKTLKISGFADKFFEYMSRGWFSLASPIWANYGNDKGLPISCVAGDTWINTKFGGKLAKDIIVGDEVLTHLGRFRRIQAIKETENRDNIYVLKVFGRMTPIRITENHEVLTNLGWIRVDKLDLKKHLVAINGDIQYEEKDFIIDLEDYCNYNHDVADYCNYNHDVADNKICKILKYVAYYTTLNSKIEVDNDLAWALGLWFAEGSVNTNNKKLPNGIRITLNVDEMEYGERWLKIICKKFNLSGKIHRKRAFHKQTKKYSEWLNVDVNSILIGNFFASFGKDCKTKLAPNWILQLPKEKLSHFLSGICLGDGSIKKNDANKLTLSNPELILQVYLMGLKLNKEMSLQMQEKPSKYNKTKYVYTILFRNYTLNRSRSNSTSGIKFYDGLIYSPISKLYKTDLVKTVYDFTVEDDHSFSACGVVMHNCNGSFIADTMSSILEKTAEVGMMTKHGAGTSAYFGDLRPRGSAISVGGKSSGPVHFMELFDAVANIISQSNVRRGSFAAYLPVDHPDINEFLNIKSEGNRIQNISIGVCINDSWMEDMIAGNIDKRKIWTKIVQKRFESGYPYLFFSDTVNKMAPQVYKDKNLKIHASNLCVSGNQRVVSQRGLLTAKELYDLGEDLILFDNTEKVQASKMELIEKNVDVYKITLENGMTHVITNYHKVVVRKPEKKYHFAKLGTQTINVECKDLKIGDYVAIQTKKGLNGDIDMPDEAFLLGLYQGDETQFERTIDIWDWIDEVEQKFDRVVVNSIYKGIRSRKYPIAICDSSPIEKKRLTSKALKVALNFEKGYIPDWIWQSNEKTQWEYIRGLYYTDGTININQSKGKPCHLSLPSTNKEFLKEVQILLCNLGITSSIHKMHEEGLRSLPDGKGGHKEYLCKTIYRLVTGNKNDALTFEENTGFITRKNKNIENRKYRDNSKKFSKVKSIEYVGKEDVYCCTVNSKKHHWVCNGIITHNCSEIFLASNENESFVCDLSSLNLLHWDEWKDTDATEILTYFLDSVMTDYIEKTKSIPFMQCAHNFAVNQRALGIGVLGWHSYLQSQMIAFESMEAKLLNCQIFACIQKKTKEASKQLAQQYGEPPLLKGYGLRNSTTMAVAPTTSSSFILGQVSPSIEPLNSNYFVKDLEKGKFTYRNPYLEDLLAKYNKNTAEVWRMILLKGGSVQHLDFLSDHEKDVFKTFGEISQKEIVIQAAQRQQYIDQGQSLNLMIHPSTSPREVSQLLIEGWRMGIKSFYYQRGTNPAQELGRNILACKSCEA